jgi:hypothetical protein
MPAVEAKAGRSCWKTSWRTEGSAGYLDLDQGGFDLSSAYCSCVNLRPGRFSYGQLQAPRASRRVHAGLFFIYLSLRPTLVAALMAGFQACTERRGRALNHRVGVACRVPT